MLKCHQLLAFKHIWAGQTSCSAELSMKQFHNPGTRLPNFSCSKKEALKFCLFISWMCSDIYWEHSGSVVECFTWDQGVAGSSITGVTTVCPWARHINPCLVLVQPRKTCPDITEKMLTGTWRIKSDKRNLHCIAMKYFHEGLNGGYLLIIFWQNK